MAIPGVAHLSEEESKVKLHVSEKTHPGRDPGTSSTGRHAVPSVGGWGGAVSGRSTTTQKQPLCL